jgi:hypothetical protein
MYRLFEKAMLLELIPSERNPMGLVELKGVSKRLRPPRILTEAEFGALLPIAVWCFWLDAQGFVSAKSWVFVGCESTSKAW